MEIGKSAVVDEEAVADARALSPFSGVAPDSALQGRPFVLCLFIILSAFFILSSSRSSMSVRSHAGGVESECVHVGLLII